MLEGLLMQLWEERGVYEGRMECEILVGVRRGVLQKGLHSSGSSLSGRP